MQTKSVFELFRKSIAGEVLDMKIKNSNHFNIRMHDGHNDYCEIKGLSKQDLLEIAEKIKRFVEKE